jgi:cell fate regulator YaaT (PSP1 superfamily)
MQTVQVRLRKPDRVYPFLSDDIALGKNDACIVRSERGLEFGVCIHPPAVSSDEDEKKISMQVVRKATFNDENTFAQLVAEEEKAKAICKRKIIERGLPMKLVECEYTFDKRRVVFYFTAEDRVDFRELVRDLAQELKTRIELRHIQVRDEAKMVGGIGSCGRELCCATWLRDFMPISMKMAKRQNLSLNPSKISGQCGRLMCCLSYENDMYVLEKKVRQQQAPIPETVVEEVEEEELDGAALVRSEVAIREETPIPLVERGVAHEPVPVAAGMNDEERPKRRRRRRRRKTGDNGGPGTVHAS